MLCGFYYFINSLKMNSDRPVQLPQKIQFLHEKIDFVHQQIKQSGLFQLKMKFIDYIDTSIQRICTLDNKNKYSSEVITKKYQQYYNAEENQREKNRIQEEKKFITSRIAQLAEKERSIQIESMRIQLQNSRFLKEKMSQEYAAKEMQIKSYTFEIEKKLKSVEKELERVIKMNTAQAKEIEMLKEERNRAQKKEMELRQRYETEIGVLQTFNSRKGKYVFRSQDGLKIYRTITNSTSSAKGCERYVFCDLPLKFHVVKLVYGIKVGQIMSSRQFDYFKEVSLYEKEEMLLSIVQGKLTLQYLKRKVILRLDKYQITKNQVVIMLFGKGDCIAINQTE